MGAQVYKSETLESAGLTMVREQMEKPVMDWQNAQPAQQLNGKALIDLRTGEKFGQVEDLLFDPKVLRVAALLYSQGGIFNRQIEALPASNVQVWGKDVLLVNRAGVRTGEATPDNDQYVRLSDQLKGRYVVSTNGDRVGQIEDVLIDDQGRLAGYDLSQVFIEGRLAELKRIPVAATSSLGKDVLIVDLDRLQ